MTQLDLLVIDKPSGMSSHDAIGRLRRITSLKRIGHAGTLDPLATGVLMVGVGRATRLLEYVVGLDKTYLATIRLGQTTDTYDAEGTIIEERPIAFSEMQLIAAIAQFQGDVKQYPPMYSAIKKDGKRLHELARKGITIERELRAVTLKTTILTWESPLLTVQIDCSSGTYIRSIAHDLGVLLGCGGHIQQLRRLRVGSFLIDQAVALDSLTAQNWIEFTRPADIAIAHLPRLTVSIAEGHSLWNGILIEGTGEGIAAAYYNEQLLGIVQGEGSSWRAHKMFMDVLEARNDGA